MHFALQARGWVWTVWTSHVSYPRSEPQLVVPFFPLGTSGDGAQWEEVGHWEHVLEEYLIHGSFLAAMM